MQETGDVFDGSAILIDDSTGIVYRKEQFTPEGSLPCEVIVRDRRYTVTGIQHLLMKAGFSIDETFFFQAGRFEKPLQSTDKMAKEIFVVAHKPNAFNRAVLKSIPLGKTW